MIFCLCHGLTENEIRQKLGQGAHIKQIFDKNKKRDCGTCKHHWSTNHASKENKVK